MAEKLLAKHEGCKLKPYRCTSGYTTIGYGRNVDLLGFSTHELLAIAASKLPLDDRFKSKLTYQLVVDLADGIPRSIAKLLLRNDIQRVLLEFYRALPWVYSLSDVRMVAMIDLGFHLGLTKLLKFHRTLEALQTGEWARAAYELKQSAYWGQTPRRAAEIAYMLEHGKMQEGES